MSASNKNFESLQKGVANMPIEDNSIKPQSVSTQKFQANTGATHPEDINSFLDDLGLTYGLEKKYVSGVRRKKKNSKPSSMEIFTNPQSAKSKMKPSPPPRSNGRKQKRVSPQRRLIPTQFDDL